MEGSHIRDRIVTSLRDYTMLKKQLMISKLALEQCNDMRRDKEAAEKMYGDLEYICIMQSVRDNA